MNKTVAKEVEQEIKRDLSDLQERLNEQEQQARYFDYRSHIAKRLAQQAPCLAERDHWEFEQMIAHDMHHSAEKECLSLAREIEYHKQMIEQIQVA